MNQDLGRGTGAHDNSNRTLAGTAGIHDRLDYELNPANKNESLGVTSDYGNVGMATESTQPNRFEPHYPQWQYHGTPVLNIDDFIDKKNVKQVTVIGGQGLNAIEVEGDVNSNFGGQTYELRKSTK